MKKLFTMVICVILSVCSVFVFASCESENDEANKIITTNGLTYYLLQDGTLGVAGHDLTIYDMLERDARDDEYFLSDKRGMYPVNYTVTELVIPEKVADKTVTTILPFGFSYFIKLEKVTLPDTVTTISDHAFLHCHELSEINLTDNITNIGYDCFLNSGISSDSVYNGSTYFGTKENPYMFLTNAVPDSDNTVNVHPDCKVLLPYSINDNNITMLYLPRGLNKINDNAFYRYKGLTDIYYNCPLSDWGNSLTEAITNVSKKIDKNAFNGISQAEKLQNVYYLDGDEYVRVFAFDIYKQLLTIGFFN